MKHIFVVIIFSSLIFSYAWSQQSAESRKLENSVQRQIEGYLSQALPANTYLVSTSARVKKVRKQVPVEEKVVVPVPQPPAPVSDDYLPGLEPLGNELNPANLPSPTTPVPPEQAPTALTGTKSYTYEDGIQIEALNVQIILDETLDQNLVSVVKKTIGDKVDISYGDAGSVIFSTANILGSRKVTSVPQAPQVEQPAVQPPVVQEAPVVKDFDYYLDKYSYILYLLFAGFIFFVMLAVFFFFLWMFLKMLSRKQQEEREIDRVRQNVTPLPPRRRVRRPQYATPQPPAIPPYYYYPPYPPNPSYPPYPYGGGYPDPRIMPPIAPVTGRANVSPDRNEPIMEKKKKLVPPSDDDVYRAPVAPPPPKLRESREPSFDELRRASVEKEEEFLEKFLNDPLMARNFFLNLDEDDQQELVGAFPKPSTRKIFSRLNSNLEMKKTSKLDGVRDLMQKEKIRQSIFNKYIEALSQHQKILSDQTQDVFGQISLLTTDELTLLFSSLDTKSIADSYQVIDSDLIYKYLEKLPDQKKNDFLKAIQDESPLLEEEVTKLREVYRNRLNTISRNMFINKTNRYELQEKVFKTLKDKKGFLEKTKTSDPEFYEANKKYTIDFNDFMAAKDAEDNSAFVRVVEDEDNEVIATAFANLPAEERDDILESLAGERQAYVRELMLPKIGQVSVEEEKEAREEILDRYRETAFR